MLFRSQIAKDLCRPPVSELARPLLKEAAGFLQQRRLFFLTEMVGQTMELSLLALRPDSVPALEGLAAADGSLAPLQAAFLQAGGTQCGICTPGMLIAAEAFIAGGGEPTDEAIREAIAGNLCRCTAYVGIVKAIQNVTAEGVS